MPFGLIIEMKASLIRLMAQMICGGYVCLMAEYRNDTARTVGRKSRGRWLASAVGLALTATACSGGSDSSAVPTVQLTSTAPTTVTTTTTIQATTTTEDPALAYERDVAEITSVYEKSLSYLGVYGANVEVDVLNSFAIDPLLERKVEYITAWSEQGFKIGDGSYGFDFIEIVVDGDDSTALSCNFDGVEVLSATGELVIPADKVRFLWASEFHRIDGEWKISDTTFANGEPTECVS